MARLGSVLLACGVLAFVFGVAWQLGWVPGSRVTLPPPVALARTPTAELAPASPTAIAQTSIATATVAPLVRPTPQPTQVPAPTPEARGPLVAADAADRASRPAPVGGYAVRLAIPSINLDTEVKQGGIVQDAAGNAIWETLPFVAVHYGELTSLLGVGGNAVIAGHVVTLNEGNVFRRLYQVELNDQIQVWDHLDREHRFAVDDVGLVPPSDTSVMAVTADEMLTLITCGGSFDPVRREFSDRLIVRAKPLSDSQADRLAR